MSGGVSPSAYTVSCPWPPVGETDATVRETSANEKPHFVKICRSVRRACRFAHCLSISLFPPGAGRGAGCRGG